MVKSEKDIFLMFNVKLRRSYTLLTLVLIRLVRNP